MNFAWKYVEILVLGLIISIDFCVRFNHFSIIRKQNSTEWTHEVKHLLSPMTGNYIQEPISKFIYYLIFAHLNVDKYFLANLITFTCVVISLPNIWLLNKVERKYIMYRQLGCMIFQIKNILDYLDGAVVRNGKATNYSQTGFKVDNGHLIDSTANAVSTLCFFIGTFLYILRKYTKSTNLRDDIQLDEVDDCNKLTNEFNRKYDRHKLLIYLFLFITYFIIASLGWDIVFETYTKEVIYNQVGQSIYNNKKLYLIEV